MILSIIIPTYNRSNYLILNLQRLTDSIRRLRKFSEIEIVISNNHSIDNTDELIKEFIKSNPSFNISYYKQESNIGLEKNVLFVLDRAQGNYVMFLGDDDYISKEYLIEVLEKINLNTDTKVIIPSFIGVNTFGEKIHNSGRDLYLKNSFYKKGFNNCFNNSWRAHQMSGLVLSREGLYETYVDYNIKNIYPFIFFVAFNSLIGSTYHLTENPIHVTQVSQSEKDWNYGDDGLVNDVFDNYSKLKINKIKITLLELFFIYNQSWRINNYRKSGIKYFFRAFKKIWFADNGTFMFKIIFPIFTLALFVKKLFTNAIKILKCQ